MVAHPLVPLALAFVLGRVLAPSYALIGLPLVLAAWWCERHVRARYLVSIPLALVAGVLCPKQASPHCFDGPPAVFLARVDRAPLVSDSERQPALLEVHAMRARGSPWLSMTNMRVFASLAPHPSIAPGDVLELTGEPEALVPPGNPSDFDLRSWGQSRGVCGSLRASDSHAHRIRARGLMSVVHRARRRVYRRLGSLDPETSAVARAVALGERREFPDDLRARWSVSGIGHLLAISGLHVTLVAGVVYGICAAAAWCVAQLGLTPRRWRKVAALVGWVAAAAYCVWAGAPISGMRATLMLGAVASGLWMADRLPPRHALALAVFGLVGWDEHVARDPGFWLSVVAVASLLLAAENPSARERFLEGLLAPAIATAPICASVFRTVALASPIANLVALPLATFVLTPCALLCCVAIVLFEQPWGIELPLSWVVGLLDNIAILASDIHWSVARLPNAWMLLLTPIAVASAAVRGTPRHVIRVVLVAALLLPGRIQPSSLRITHIAVGQGDSTLIRAPNGQAWLIDGGGRVGPGRREPGRDHVVPALLDAGVTALDAVVATHGDADHVQGLHAVLDRIRVDRLYWNARATPSARMSALLEHAGAVGARIVPVSDPLEVRLGEVSLALSGAPSEQTENDASVAIVLTYRGFRALFAGDATREREWELAKHLEAVDLLLAPHHGSRTSTSEALLRASEPRAVVISVGRRNRYRMPHQEVTQRLMRFGIPFFRMDESGQVRVETFGEGFTLDSEHRGGLRCFRECVLRQGSHRP